MCCSTRFSEKRGLLLIDRAVFGDRAVFSENLAQKSGFMLKKVDC
jgi:hypothetical protein